MLNRFKSLPTNYKSALIIFIAVLLWIASGVLKSDTKDSSIKDVTVEKIISIRAVDIEAEDKTYYLTIRGRTEAKNKAILRPKTTSTVLKTAEKGQFVTKGTIICALDPEDRVARLDEAVANEKQAQLKYDGVQKLAEDGYRSDNAVATAEAILKGAIARREIAQNAVNNSDVKAPFDGFLEDVNVKIGDLISPSQSCGSIIQFDPMIVSGEVTEKNVIKIISKQEIDVVLLNNSTIKGNISYISKSASPATRTYKIEATFKNSDGLIREGLTANIKIPLENIKAHLVPSYLLSLDDEGELGIKITENNVVKFVSIKIIEDSPEGIWVVGLPDKSKIITVGQEYVIGGQTVNVQTVES